MDMKAVGHSNITHRTPPKAAKKAEREKPVNEPQDKVTLGKIAKGAGKVVLGTAMAAVVAPAKGLFKGSIASTRSALTGIKLGDFKKDGILSNVVRGAMYAAPALGAAAAFTLGAGPVGIVLAGLATPGIIGGAASGISGAVDGFGKGINVALNVSDKADKVIGKRLGKAAGKLAKFTAGVATGLVAAPVGAFLGALAKRYTFAERAIGVKMDPKGFKEKAQNLTLEAGVASGYIIGALGSSGGGIALASAAGAGAGAVATTVKGGAAAIEGFTDGVVRSYKAAGSAVDTLTGGK